MFILLLYLSMASDAAFRRRAPPRFTDNTYAPSPRIYLSSPNDISFSLRVPAIFTSHFALLYAASFAQYGASTRHGAGKMPLSTGRPAISPIEIRSITPFSITAASARTGASAYGRQAIKQAIITLGSRAVIDATMTMRALTVRAARPPICSSMPLRRHFRVSPPFQYILFRPDAYMSFGRRHLAGVPFLHHTRTDDGHVMLYDEKNTSDDRRRDAEAGDAAIHAASRAWHMGLHSHYRA